MGEIKVAGFITDWLRADGSASYGAVGWYRVKNALEKLGHTVYGKTHLGGTMENALKHTVALGEKGNIWFWKPVDNEGIHVFLDTAKHFTGAKLILDLDDHPFVHNEKHPLYEKLVKKRPMMEAMILLSDHIVVSTEPLKQALKKYGKKITVIPNAIDPEIWKVKKAEARADNIIRIGWIGSGSHLADTHIINGAFNRILAKYPNVEIHLCGFVDNDSSRGEREFHHKPTIGYKEYPQYVADLDLDIAVAPLMDSEFNRAKSNIKWLEHSMLATPMVLSNVTPYKECVEDRKTGFLAKGEDQWVKYLSWLIEDPLRRKTMGEAAKKKVMAEYLISKQLPKYEKLFNDISEKDITVYTVVSGPAHGLIEEQCTDGATFVAFAPCQSDTWEIRPPYDKFKENRRNSRIQKIMPHLFIDSEYSIYIDSNFRLKVPPQQLIDEFLKDHDVAVFKHGGRDCVYDEVDACVALQKDSPQALSEQAAAYAKIGWPQHSGLAAGAVIIRRHTPLVARWNEAWWAQYCRYSVRDQISFPLAFPLDKINLIEGPMVEKHPYFEFRPHREKK